MGDWRFIFVLGVRSLGPFETLMIKHVNSLMEVLLVLSQGIQLVSSQKLDMRGVVCALRQRTRLTTRLTMRKNENTGGDANSFLRCHGHN